MGRYVNWLLIAVGVAAAAMLTIEGVLNHDILNTELSSLMCVITAVPPVIAAIRMETGRRIEATTRVIVGETTRLGDMITSEIRNLGDRLQTVMTETAQAHAEQMKTAVVEHGDRLGKHQLEVVLGTLKGAETSAMMEAADRRADALRWTGTETGPFRIPQ